jgi:hypothetical protein
MSKPFWHVAPRWCPFILFPYYSHICAICPFIALYSPLIFLQQQLLDSAEKWGVLPGLFTFWFVRRPNFARTTLLTLLCSLSPSCSSFLTLCHDSILVVDSFCFGSLGLGSLLIVAALLLLFVHGLISLASFLVIPFLFNSLYDVCIVCYTYNIYLTTLFDVYCMLYDRFVVCRICLPNVM